MQYLHELGDAPDERAPIGSARAEASCTPAVVTTPQTPVAEAARLASRARVHRLPVVDDDGVLVGILARADLLRVFLRSRPH